jgi:hypothetical protein
VDFHHNVFYSYRGPIAEDADRDRQLENNLTKALINTLSWGGPPVWQPFLAALGISGVPRRFLLQRREIPGGIANKRHRLLLGISNCNSNWLPCKPIEPSYESVPDAWVYGDGFAVLMESKVKGDFLPGQMQAHLKRLEITNGNPTETKLLAWKELHRLFCGILQSLNDTAPRFLVEQFIQFLEYSGMSGFTGFRREHFDYFVLHDDDDVRRWVLDQVKEFASLVWKNLHDFAPFYEAFEIGALERTNSYCWIAFGPADRAYRKVTHQTMTLSSAGLQVFVNTELKIATDQLKSVVSKSGHAFRAELKRLHEFEPFDVVLEERKQRQASLYEYTPKMQLHSSMLADVRSGDVAWQAFSQTVQQLPLPYLKIVRLIRPPRLLELSNCDLPKVVDYVVDIFKQNHAVVSLLNG